ncbi:MAG: metallophosphoesterase [Actinomycetota bacterium]|nr:metallophosphoesterase [Actinomycetota bacterium]
MKIAALGDAHVGRSSYPVAYDGVNVREKDFERSFLEAVDLLLDQSPDLILFLGDIFDFPRPSFRSFRTVQKGLFVIKRSGIPLVAISGNHDTPRLHGTESPYGALHDVFPEFGLIYRQQYECFDVGEVRIHGIPQMLAEVETAEALEMASSNKSFSKVNLVITHPRVKQLTPSYADINEIELDAEDIKGDFALLGHYHFHAKVKENMWYVGSTDTFSFGDSPELSKGIAVLDTDSGECSHVALKNQRSLLDLGLTPAFGLGARELEQIVEEQLACTPEGSVARLRLDGVDPAAYRLVDPAVIRELSSHLLYFRLEPLYLSAALEVELPELDSMPSKWMRFVEQQDVADGDKHEISQMGIEYINKAIEAS